MSLHKLLIVYARSDLRDTRRKLELGARSWSIAMGVGDGKRVVRIGKGKELARPITASTPGAMRCADAARRRLSMPWN